jgi:hypothetical protein
VAVISIVTGRSGNFRRASTPPHHIRKCIVYLHGPLSGRRMTSATGERPKDGARVAHTVLDARRVKSRDCHELAPVTPRDCKRPSTQPQNTIIHKTHTRHDRLRMRRPNPETSYPTRQAPPSARMAPDSRLAVCTPTTFDRAITVP